MIDAIYCAKNFYVLEALKLIVERRMEFGRKSHETLLEDIMTYRQKYMDGLKQAIYDYTALVVYGEMRHGASTCTHCNPLIPQKKNRGSAYNLAKEFNPTSILIAGEKLFSRGNWSSAYGGEKWRLIANRVQLINKIDDGVYCDMCFSLSHNSSPYLDKSASNIFRIIDKCGYKNVLDYKFKCNRPINLISSYAMYVGKQLKKLITRAIILGFISEFYQDCVNEFFDYDQFEAEDYILNYKGVQWGNVWLEDGIIQHRESINDIPYSSIPTDVSLMNVKVGDKLEIAVDKPHGYRIEKDTKVEVLEVNRRYQKIGVKFQKDVGGNSMHGKCNYGHGLYLEPYYLKKVLA